MDFFAHQELARKKTALFVALFTLAVILIVLAVYAVFALLLNNGEMVLDPDLFAYVSLGTLAVVGLGTAYKTIQLSQGGSAVAEMLGGRPIAHDTAHPLERRLLNVVEEMAIASGIPPPRVYILDEEPGINAFAAGFSPSDAVVAVTRGCAELLSRDELQGVIAHEFSHIFNGDMRMNLRLMGVLHGILLLGMVGMFVFRNAFRLGGSGSSRRDREKGGAAVVLGLMVLGLAVAAIGYIGVFFAKIIKSAAARQREFLADASAVQFTRNPLGIANALKKIGGLANGSRIQSHRAEQVSHMFFANGLTAGFARLMATHPPLLERIRRIDPSFDGAIKPIERTHEQNRVRAEAAAAVAPAADLVPALAAGQAAFRPRAQMVRSVGSVRPEAVSATSSILSALPAKAAALVRETHGARAIVYALLLDQPGPVRDRQLASFEDAGERERVLDAARVMDAVPRWARLPLMDLAIPALRGLAPAEHEAFRKKVRSLIEADSQISLFEYCVAKMVARRLDPFFGGARPVPVRFSRPAQVRDELRLLLSTLAYYGGAGVAAAKTAYAAGAAVFGGALPVEPLPPDQCGLAQVDRALAKLDQSSPSLKKTVLDACVACTVADERASDEESEMIRAVADTLGCPIPPMFAAPQAA